MPYFKSMAYLFYRPNHRVPRCGLFAVHLVNQSQHNAFRYFLWVEANRSIIVAAGRCTDGHIFHIGIKLTVLSTHGKEGALLADDDGCLVAVQSLKTCRRIHNNVVELS